MSRCLVVFLVILILVPSVSLAQSDTQSQIITLLTQIIALQKQLILSLQAQIAQLTGQPGSSMPGASAAGTGGVSCPSVSVPACSTALTTFRDSNNCVIEYRCSAATSAANQGGSGLSCTTPWGNLTVSSGGTAPVEPYFTSGAYSGIAQIPQRKCENGQWLPVSTIAATGASCTRGGVQFANGQGINSCTYDVLGGAGSSCAGAGSTISGPPGWFCQNGTFQYIGSACGTGYGWCPAGPYGFSCALLNNGVCPQVR